MQVVSEKFKESIRDTREIRNRGYIKVNVGIINQVAQNNAKVDESKGSLMYFSNAEAPFNADVADKIYVTGEKDFSKVDGSMYFPPRDKNANFYNNGIVSKELLGNIYISFGQEKELDIKGLTINFGECYPTEFTIDYDGGKKAYKNDKPIWYTEDVFSNVSFFNIKPLHMVNEYGRLRILEFSCGFAKNFSNDNVIKCQFKDYVSPISETLSSQDLTLEIDNRDLYFDVDDDSSAISFMETGQEVIVNYGYDVDGDGKIEWIPAQKCYMSKWSATDRTVKFQATDRFNLMNGTYDKGEFYSNGINLYDLAIDVLNDAGITDKREYFLDPYLKKVTVYNPMPAVMHREALQIIANTGRCKLYQGRDGKIFIKSDFIPKQYASTNDIVEYSNIENVLKRGAKPAYAMGSNDFSKVDGSLFFLPRKAPYLPIGYVSKSVADADGNFKTNPKITIDLEASFICFGLLINFRNVKPELFTIKTYLQNVIVDNITVKEPQMNCIVQETFDEFDKIEIEFIKGYPNARVTIDNILLGDYTDYHLSNDCMHKQTIRDKKKKIKSISVSYFSFVKETEKKELSSETVVLEKGHNEYTAYFDTPSCDFEVSIENNPQIQCKIEEASTYHVKVSFDGVQGETSANVIIKGYEYLQNTRKYVKKHDTVGEIIEWSNPLISTEKQARELEEWLASYLLGSVDYNIDWWGDPTTDAGDLFYFLTQTGDEVLVKSYENSLSFSSGWSGKMKARRVVLE